MLKKVSLWSYAVGLFLTPFVFLPGAGLPVDVVKIVLLYIAFGLSFLTWFIGSIANKKFELPRPKYFIPALALFVASLVSLIFSPSLRVSFAGFGFDPLSFMTILALLVVLFMTSIHLTSAKKLRTAMLFFLVSGWVLTLVELVLLVAGPGAWTLGLTNVKHLVFLSSWQSFIAYVGFLFLAGMWFNKYFAFNKTVKVIAQVMLFVQFVFIVLGNLTAVNVAVLLGGLVYVVATYFAGRKGDANSENKKNAFNTVMSVLFVLFFISSIFLPGLYSKVAGNMGVSYVDVRPSFSATLGAQVKSITNEHMFFGSGPTRFDSIWNKYKPADVTLTNFATTKFAFGSSTLTTLAVTLGILGLIAVILFLLSVMSSVFKFLRKTARMKELDSNVLLMHMMVVYFFTVLSLYVPSAAIVILGFASLGALVWSSNQDKDTYVLSLDSSSKMKSIVLYVLSYLGVLIALALFVYSFVLFVGTMNTARALSTLNKEGATDKVEKLLVSSAKLLRNDLAYNNLADFYSLRLRAITLDTKTPQDALVEQFRNTFSQVEGAALLSVQYDPTNSANWQRIGTLYQSVIPFKVKGAYEGSKVAYQKLYELSPMSPEPDVLLARLELVNGDKETVRKFIDQALVKKPNAIGVMIFRSNFELEDGNQSDALAWAVKAVKTEPSNANALYQLAFIQYRTGSYSDATKTIMALNQIAPNNIDVASLLVLVDEKSGKINEAITILEQLAKAYPNSKEVKDKLDQLKNPTSTTTTETTDEEEKTTN